MPEISALEQQRLPKRFGKRITEAVAKVQPGFVVSFAKQHKSLTGKHSLIRRHGLDPNRELEQKRIQHRAPDLIAVSVHIDCGFHITRRGDSHNIGLFDGHREPPGFGFTQQHRQQCGGIQNQ